MKPTVIKNPLNALKQIDIAALFGVTDRTIRNWDKEGLPGNGEGRDRVYDFAAVLPWYVGRVSGSRGSDDDLTDREREQKATADIAEMKAQEMAGFLVNAQEVQKGWADFLTRLRTNLMGFPARLVDRLEGARDIREKIAIGNREMASTLRDIVAELENQDSGSGE
jgi:phage terminase Nu1 subunit (DNA packaging protein)